MPDNKNMKKQFNLEAKKSRLDIRKDAETYARRVAKHLKIYGQPDDHGFDTSVVGAGISAFLTELLHDKWLIGTEALAIEWGLDHFLANWVMKHLHLAIEIYQRLVERQAREKKPFVWNDLDSESFYIPNNKGMMIWITDDGNNDPWLFIRQEDSISVTIHVRKPSRRSCKNTWPIRLSLKDYKEKDFIFGEKGVGYGDCRDPGYILSLEEHKPLFGIPIIPPKIDHGYAMFADIRSFIQELSFLHTALIEEPDSPGK